MNSIAMRLWIVTALVATGYGATYLVQASTEPPEVRLPDWNFAEMPQQLGDWRGENMELDPKIMVRLGAASVTDRMYRNETGQSVSSHTAIFADPREAVDHRPDSCYRGAGWLKIDETSAEVSIGENRTIPVYFTTWERNGDRVLVVYWYQIGEQVILDRMGLGTLRWTMRGQPVWPATVKVLLQTSAWGDPDDAKASILNIAEQIGKWINQPSHQTQLGDE